MAWSTNGEVVWALDSEACTVDDCYALNVGPQEVFACPYSDFPILRIAGGDCTVTERAEHKGRGGSSARVTSWRSSVLTGSHEQCLLGRLSEGGLVETARFNLAGLGWAGKGTPRVICRGSVAHAFIGTDRYAVDLADVTG